MPDRNKTLTVITVAALHGIALYGLVTGLGVKYIEQAATVLTGKNIPIKRVPPPPESTTPEPMKPEPSTTVQKARPSTATVVESVPTPLATSGNIVIDFPIKPLPPISIDPPGPIASASPDKSLFMPRLVRPRGDPGQWVSTSDYPAASLRRGEQGTVRFELAVGGDSRVTDCRITASSGSTDLDTATCRLVTRRAHFEPATDETGARVSGTYKGSIRWMIPQD
jgi:protein TonB